MGLALIPCAVAQAPAEQTTAASAAMIPADQQPTKEQLAKLFELMQVKQHLILTIQMAQQQLFAQARQTQKDHPETAAQDAAVAMNLLMEKIIDPDEMLADISALYRKHLTRSDVDGMIAFYSTPAGQHWIAAQPVISNEYMPIVMKRVQERMKPAAAR
jgi:hypothetical protein